MDSDRPYEYEYKGQLKRIFPNPNINKEQMREILEAEGYIVISPEEAQEIINSYKGEK